MHSNRYLITKVVKQNLLKSKYYLTTRPISYLARLLVCGSLINRMNIENIPMKTICIFLLLLTCTYLSFNGEFFNYLYLRNLKTIIYCIKNLSSTYEQLAEMYKAPVQKYLAIYIEEHACYNYQTRLSIINYNK